MKQTTCVFLNKRKQRWNKKPACNKEQEAKMKQKDQKNILMSSNKQTQKMPPRWVKATYIYIYIFGGFSFFPRHYFYIKLLWWISICLNWFCLAWAPNRQSKLLTLRSSESLMNFSVSPRLGIEFFPWALLFGYSSFFLILGTWQDRPWPPSKSYFLDKPLGSKRHVVQKHIWSSSQYCLTINLSLHI